MNYKSNQSQWLQIDLNQNYQKLIWINKSSHTCDIQNTTKSLYWTVERDSLNVAAVNAVIAMATTAGALVFVFSSNSRSKESSESGCDVQSQSVPQC